MSKIVSWQCHVCGAAFDAPEGGVCVKCSQPTCESCLRRVIRGDAANQIICEFCLSADDVIDREQFVRDWFAEWTANPVVYGWATDLMFEKLVEEPQTAWDLILDLINRAPDDEALGCVAAGPLEDLLCEHGFSIIDRVEALALSNSRFKKCLAGVCGQNRMPPEIYARVRRAVGDPGRRSGDA